MARGRVGKLTDEDIREILAMPPGSDWTWVAGVYGISRRYVGVIRAGCQRRVLRIRHEMQKERAA